MTNWRAALRRAQERSRAADGGATEAEADPLEWCRRKGIQLYAKQREILTAALSHKRTNVISCNGSGKTYCVAALAAWHIARHGKRGRVVIVAPSARQVRTGIIPHVAAFLAGERGISVLREIVRIDAHVALQVVALSTFVNQSTGLGMHAPELLVILEESSGLTEQQFRQVFTWTSGAGGHMLAIGNPWSGSMAEQFCLSPQWFTMRVTAFDCPAFYTPEQAAADPIPLHIVNSLTGQEFVDSTIADYGIDSEQYRSAVEGRFSDMSTMLYFAPASIQAAFDSYLDIDTLALDRPTLGIDVAGAGADTSAVYACWPVRNAGKIKYVIRDVTTPEIRKCSEPKNTGALAATLATSLNAERLRIDSFGIGASTLAIARQLLGESIAVDGINTGSKASNPHQYSNKRSEIAATLRQRLNDGLVAIQESARLRQELLAHRKTPAVLMREKLELKADVKKRIGRSPDLADALFLTVMPALRRPAKTPF